MGVNINDDNVVALTSAKETLAVLKTEGGKEPLHVRLNLGNTPKDLGIHKVSAVGIEYFSDAGRPCSVKASGPVTITALVKGLVDSHKKFHPAYWVVLASGEEVQISTYWSSQIHGAAPELEIGSDVRVFADLGRTGRARFTYQRAA